MINLRLSLVALALLASPAVLQAQTACASAVVADLVTSSTPSSAKPNEAQKLRPRTTAELRKLAEDLFQRSAESKDTSARSLLKCRSAEMFKRSGDRRAESLYVELIRDEPANAEYYLLFGDYLRNYRGPGQPIFGRAADLYYQGLKTADSATENLLRRSLVALYEREGIALSGDIASRRQWLLFSSQNVGARSTDDLASVDTVQTLTSAAMFAGSGERLGRTLTDSELGAIIRNVSRGSTFQRLRARGGPLAVDAYFQASGSGGSQIIRFDDPATRGNVGFGFGGAGVEYVGAVARAFDVLVRGDLKVGLRRGLIEYLPNDTEAVRSTRFSAVLSRFVGPDKFSLEGTLGHDSVEQRTAAPIERDQSVWGITGRYQIFRPLGNIKPYERPIAARGSEVFAGTSRGREAFGDIDVLRQGYFVGASLNGLPGGGEHTWDLTLQPTLSRYSRESVLSARPVDPLANGQTEIFATLRYRLVDHENERNINLLPGLVTLNVVGLASVARASTGLDAFERNRYGAQLDAKLVGRQRGGMTWLASTRYEHQTFSKLHREANVLMAWVNLGF